MSRILPTGPLETTRPGTLPRPASSGSGVRFEFDAFGCGPRTGLTAEEFAELLEWARVKYARPLVGDDT